MVAICNAIVSKDQMKMEQKFREAIMLIVIFTLSIGTNRPKQTM